MFWCRKFRESWGLLNVARFRSGAFNFVASDDCFKSVHFIKMSFVYLFIFVKSNQLTRVLLFRFERSLFWSFQLCKPRAHWRFYIATRKSWKQRRTVNFNGRWVRTSLWYQLSVSSSNTYLYVLFRICHPGTNHLATTRISTISICMQPQPWLLYRIPYRTIPTTGTCLGNALHKCPAMDQLSKLNCFCQNQ